MNRPLITITMGDPCGIGPEIIAGALADPEITGICRPLVMGDPAVMQRALAVTGHPLRLLELPDGVPGDVAHPGTIHLRPLSALKESDMRYGYPSEASGAAVVTYIRQAVSSCMSGETAAMVTAPINKEAMNRAGFHYPGHTELLAELTGTEKFVMMLAGGRLRVTLVTIHEALKDVPAMLTTDRILSTISITHDHLSRYVTERPRLAVLGLNPHGGEGGMFGTEEELLIAPAVCAARRAGMDVRGPFSADTLFHFAARGDYDAVVCMYHDQGLIPLKLLHFDDGVNVTLGLPIIRTSVDHGTAYGLAGTGRASTGSMTAAIRMAVEMARFRSGLQPVG